VTSTYVPVTSFIYTLRYKSAKHLFTDMNSSEIKDYFDNLYLNPEFTRDRTTYWAVTNTLGVSLLEGFNKYAKFGLAAYVTHQVRRYNQTPDTLDRSNPDYGLTPFPEGIGSIKARTTQQLAWVGAQLTKQNGSILKYNATAEIGMLGEAAGEIKIDGNATTRFKVLGDSADIDRLIDIRRRYPQVMLYVDEAHAFGVCGPRGLGLVAASQAPGEVDVVIGTFGKAAGSMGAFAITSDAVRQYLVNTSRPLIFSTALPPMQAAWTRFALSALLSAERRRAHLQWLAERLNKVLRKYSAVPIAVSHIQPLIIGDSKRVVELSHKLLHIYGLKALPIRKPTVPAGTERLRISLSASLNGREIDELDRALADLLPVVNPDTKC